MNAPLDEIIEAIGLPLALRLVERFGGTRIALPLAANLSSENPVARVIGLEATRKLCLAWGGERPSVPRASAYLRARRNRDLCADAETMSIPALALKYTLTERAVYRVLAREPFAPRSGAAQPELFERGEAV